MKGFLCTVFGLFSFLLPVHAHPPQAAPSRTRPHAAPRPGPAARPKRRRRHGPARTWPGQGDPAVERARRCILEREGGSDYQVVDRSHRWFGAYQFQLRTSNAAALRMHRPDLVGVPANQWAPEDQDGAFYVIYDRGRGKGHWAGGHYPCF